MCNQEVKFKLFLETALEDGADMIATGHYARTKDGKLLQAVDSNKDQTYFLYRVTGDALKKTLFPLGDHTKPEVRRMAAERGLFTAGKKDSQGICFVGQIGIRDFLSQYISTRPGDIVDRDSKKVLGRHDGAIFYTLGQRHGLNLGGGLPYYVVGKNMDSNEVYVTRDLNDGALWKTQITLDSLHWINEMPLDGNYQIRVRHRAQLVFCDLAMNGSCAVLKLSEPQRAVTAGQSVVVYSDDACLGGGIVVG
jgi:tRNA-specific 2-thiouridylase